METNASSNDRTGDRRTAAAIVAGSALTAGVGYFGGPYLGLDNAIRFLVVEGAVAVGAALLALVVLKRASRRVRWSVFGLAALAAGGLLACFQFTWRGDMQQGLRPRRWVLDSARRAGFDVGDVIHQPQVAAEPLSIVPGADDSPQFLGGPARTGRVTLAPRKLARDWNARPPQAIWRRPIADGWSSFAVVGHYGFTQEQTTDELAETVTSYDLRDGSLRWVHADAGGFDWFLGGKGPRATPAFHDGKLVTLGSNGLVNCFDAATGRVVWRHDLAAEMQVDSAQWGKSESPLIVDVPRHGTIVVVAAGVKAEHLGGHGPGPNPPAALVAYRLSDGGEVWRGGDFSAGYCSPQLSTLAGVPQILVVHWQTLAAHDPDSGRVLWSWDGWDHGQPKVPQPLVVDDRRVLASAGYGVGCRMLEVGRDADGAWSVKELWKSAKLKPKFTNLVMRDGHAFGLDDGEFLVCLDLADGKLKWRSPRGKDFGHGQVLLVDDLLLVTTENGDVMLIAADVDEYREFGRFTALPDGTGWNVPVVWGDKLLVRNDEEAACFQLPTE